MWARCAVPVFKFGRWLDSALLQRELGPDA
jgi:L-amino acid N-acyltransferase YncA